MATIKAVLSKDRMKKCGGYALVIQVIHKRSKRVIYTPYSLREEEFDTRTQKAIYTDGIRFTHKEIQEINDFIPLKIEKLKKTIAFVSGRERNYTINDIIQKYKDDEADSNLIIFTERLIWRKRSLNKMGTAKALLSTLRSLKKFMGECILTFADIDISVVKAYEDFMQDSGLSENTINFYMRNFRSIYNLAEENGMEVSGKNPFSKMNIKSCKTVKRALQKTVIQRIATIDLSHERLLDRARDFFMFSFYTRGMSFVDIVYLKHSNIVDGVITYRRQKTHQYIRVGVTAPLQAIIDKYRGDDTYVLPFISESKHETLYGKYQTIYSVLYKNLKKLRNTLGLSTPLTFHVARHSWATIAKEEGGSILEISEGLGHSTEKMTTIYLKEFDCSVIDSLNERVVHFSSQ